MRGLKFTGQNGLNSIQYLCTLVIPPGDLLSDRFSIAYNVLYAKVLIEGRRNGQSAVMFQTRTEVFRLMGLLGYYEDVIPENNVAFIEDCQAVLLRMQRDEARARGNLLQN